MKNVERLNATAATCSITGRGVLATEQALATGVYKATLRGYKKQHKDEYLMLHAAREVLLAALPESAFIDAATGETIEPLRTQSLRRRMVSLEEVKAEIEFPNVVTTFGKNYLLDNGLAGSAYTAAFYMGLISSVSYSAVAAADTMASHAGWLEAGATNAPTYSGSRKTAAWASASAGSKALSAGLVFTFTGAGTVKGCFLNTVATVDGTTGTLYSAGLFTGGDQPVVATNTLTVTYAASL